MVSCHGDWFCSWKTYKRAGLRFRVRLFLCLFLLSDPDTMFHLIHSFCIKPHSLVEIYSLSESKSWLGISLLLKDFIKLPLFCSSVISLNASFCLQIQILSSVNSSSAQNETLCLSFFITLWLCTQHDC